MTTGRGHVIAGAAVVGVGGGNSDTGIGPACRILLVLKAHHQ